MVADKFGFNFKPHHIPLLKPNYKLPNCTDEFVHHFSHESTNVHVFIHWD
jgi:hypothetical protein